MTEAQLYALAEYESDPNFSEAERAAIAYADAMTSTPVHVGDELFARLRTSFNEVQIVELTGLIAWENFRARFNHALGIESQGFSEGQFCPLPATHT